jgi:hypothetical protein
VSQPHGGGPSQNSHLPGWGTGPRGHH